MTTTKLKAKEMGQIIETLPKESRNALKSTYENVIDLGIEKGIERGIERGIEKGIEKGIIVGKKRWQELERLQMTLHAVQSGVGMGLIVSLFNVPEELVKLLSVNNAEGFQAKEFAIILAREILKVFGNLEVEDIAAFCKLEHSEVAKLKEKLM